MSSTAFVNGSTLSDAAWANDADTVTYNTLSSVAGTNTITGTGPVSMTAYANGQFFKFIPANINTGATTLNITPSGSTALGAKNIFSNGAALAGGELVTGIPAYVTYDGTQFNLMNTGKKGAILDSAVSSVSVASASVTNVTSLALTVGTWDLSAVVQYNGSSGVTRLSASISTTTASNAGTVSGKSLVYGAADTSSGTGQAVIPRFRVVLTADTTYYLNAQLIASGPQNCDGYFSAVRV